MSLPCYYADDEYVGLRFYGCVDSASLLWFLASFSQLIFLDCSVLIFNKNDFFFGFVVGDFRLFGSRPSYFDDKSLGIGLKSPFTDDVPPPLMSSPVIMPMMNTEA